MRYCLTPEFAFTQILRRWSCVGVSHVDTDFLLSTNELKLPTNRYVTAESTKQFCDEVLEILPVCGLVIED